MRTRVAVRGRAVRPHRRLPRPAVTARERLIHLLQHYREAPLAHTGPPGNGETGPFLSSMWNDSSYPELDRWLRTMRTCRCTSHRHRKSCKRRVYWHLREWYIDAEQKAVDVPLRRGKLVLPPGCTLIAGQMPSLLPNGTQTARAVVLRRNPVASRREAENGLQWLLERMHGGRSDRITLPKILRQAS